MEKSFELPRSVTEVEKKESYFKAILLNKLYETMLDGLVDAGVDKKHVDEFFNQIKMFSEDDIFGMLAIPFELQETLFERFAQQLADGKTTVTEFIKFLHDRAQKHGYTVGFHVSNADIQPQIFHKDGGTQIRWQIAGSEKDIRDADIQRAYYSLDYQHLYRYKSARFLYMIRAETAASSSHRRDNDGSWGRASILPIIAQLDLVEVDEKIHQLMTTDQRDQKKAA